MDGLLQAPILIVLVTFVAPRTTFSSPIVERHPYWSHYLRDVNVIQLRYTYKDPIEVWPDRVLENLTRLEVGG